MSYTTLLIIGTTTTFTALLCCIILLYLCYKRNLTSKNKKDNHKGTTKMNDHKQAIDVKDLSKISLQMNSSFDLADVYVSHLDVDNHHLDYAVSARQRRVIRQHHTDASTEHTAAVEGDIEMMESNFAHAVDDFLRFDIIHRESSSSFVFIRL